MPICEDCRWFDKSGGPLGLCRVRSPKVITHGQHEGEGVWPQVAPDDWCACWEEADD